MVRWLSILALALAVAAGPAAAERAAETREVLRGLARIHEAAGRNNFRGTIVVSAAGMLSSWRVAHYCDGKNQVERIEPLDGQKRQILRRNEVVHTMWPASRQVVIEQRDVAASFPSLLQGGRLAAVDRHYVLQPLGTDRVAGYAADVLQLKPRDGHRFGYRLWSEKASALLLRAEVLGPRGEVLESTAFTHLEIGVKPRIRAVVSLLRPPDGWRVSRIAPMHVQLESEGWLLRPVVPGFVQISCLKRAVEPRAADGEVQQVLQSVWTDGLTSVSIFIERYDPQRHRPLQTALGATQTIQRKKDEWWITAMGEVPVATLRQFADALERRR